MRNEDVAGGSVSPVQIGSGQASPQTSGNPHHQGQRRRAVQPGP